MGKTKSIPQKSKDLINKIKRQDNFFTRNLFVICAFLIPFLFVFVCFAFKRVAPFGNNQILVTDLWHQYYPFLSNYQNKLHEGGSLLWTWNIGGGTNYLALMSYYLASPLNFLSVLVPVTWLRQFLYVITCVKIGCAGGFFAIFLRSTFKKNDVSITIFSIMYALCSYIMGYYWCVIWLDTIALLPLVICGTFALLKEGKFRLYVISLALSILANYYIGLFTCIFVVLVSIGYIIVENFKNFKTAAKRIGQLAGCSLLGGAMSAILTVPAYLALQISHSAASTFPKSYAINIGSKATVLGVLEGFAKTIANSIAFIAPNTKEGLPNIYCGMIALFLGILFFTCGKIKIRERIFCGVLELFIIYSFIDRRLDYMWHGFHFPNMLPYRFSFLFSFVLVYMAFRLYQNIDSLKLYQVIIGSGVLVGILVLSKFYDETLALIGSAVISLILIAWVILYSLRVVPKEALAIALCIVVLAEGIGTVIIGIKTVSVTDGANYPLSYKNVMGVLDDIDKEEEGNLDLYREELTKCHTLNDIALYNMRGISQFNSIATESVSIFMEKLGIASWPGSNRYTYYDSSVYTDMLLNIKYKVTTNQKMLDTEHYSLFAQDSNTQAFKNNYYVNQGFIVNDSLLDFDTQSASQNPFDNQNKIFTLSTGIEENIYEALEVASQGHTSYEVFPVNKEDYGKYSFKKNEDCDETPHVKYNYTAPRDGTCCIYFDCNGSDNCTVKINDEDVNEFYVRRPFIMNCGQVKEGDKISVYADIRDKDSGTIHVYCNMLNEELLEKAYEIYNSQTLQATKLTDTEISGYINVTQDNALLYTSISYDPGWKAYVDGKEVPIQSLSKGLIALKIDKGEHLVELRYRTEGLRIALILTIGSIVIFAFFCFMSWSLKKHKKDNKENEDNNAKNDSEETIEEFVQEEEFVETETIEEEKI